MHYNLKKFISLSTHVKICNFLIALSPILSILGIALIEIVIIYACLIAIYSFFAKVFTLNYNYFFYLFLSLYLVLFISSALSGDQSSVTKSFLYIRFYLFYLFIINYFNKYFFKLLCKFCACALLFVYFDVLFQFITGKDILGYKPEMSLSRYQGPFRDELISGAYIKKYLFISIAFILSLKKFFLLNLYILLSIIIVILSGEKMSLVLIFVGLFLFFIIYYKIKKKLLIYCLLVPIIVVFSLFNFDTSNNKISGIKSRYTNQLLYALGIGHEHKNKTFANSVHGVHFQTALELFKAKPLIGFGLKQYRDKCQTIKPEKLNELYGTNIFFAEKYRCTTHPHNFYLEILSEGGIFSFLLIFLIIFHFLKKSKISFKENSDAMTKNLLFLAFFVHIFPIATTGSFFTNHNSYHFWLILSLIEFLHLNRKVKVKFE